MQLQPSCQHENLVFIGFSRISGRQAEKLAGLMPHHPAISTAP
jgi:hypothetical protein